MKLPKGIVKILLLLAIALLLVVAFFYKHLAVANNQSKQAYLVNNQQLLLLNNSGLLNHNFGHINGSKVLYNLPLGHQPLFGRQFSLLYKNYIVFVSQKSNLLAKRGYWLNIFTHHNNLVQQLAITARPLAIYRQAKQIKLLYKNGLMQSYNITTGQWSNDIYLKNINNGILNNNAQIFYLKNDSLLVANPQKFTFFNSITGQIVAQTSYKSPIQAMDIANKGDSWAFYRNNKLYMGHYTKQGLQMQPIYGFVALQGPLALKFSPDGNFLLAVNGQNIAVFNSKTSQLLWQHPFPSGKLSPSVLNFAPNGDYFILGGNLSGQLTSLFIYQTATGRLVQRLLGLNDHH
jgi:WD40 repeat protein